MLYTHNSILSNRMSEKTDQSLEPIQEHAEIENGHSEDEIVKSAVNGDTGVMDKSAEQNKPVIMDEKRKKRAELELSKFVNSRLAVEQNRKQQEEQLTEKKVIQEQTVSTPREEVVVNEEAGAEIEDKCFSENEPITRTDVVRQADTDDKDEYPEEG